MIAERKILVTIRGDEQTARDLAASLEAVALALLVPTQAHASEAFRIGAECVVVAAERERDAERSAAA